MRRIPLFVCGLVLGGLAVCKLASPEANVAAASARPGTTLPLEVTGRTRCIPSHRGIIAASILRPVVEVLVSPGDRVTKGQELIKLFDQEPQARLRAREQELRSIQPKAQASRRILDFAEKSRETGAVPQNTYNEIRGTALSNEAQVLAAEAELSLARGELQLYTLKATLDGEVVWLDVSPGTVTWPGAMVWGEIMDLRELDVRCELSQAQVEQIVMGQSAELWFVGKPEPVASGKVVFIGNAADRASGLIPVLVRVANTQQRLRAEIAVKVRFLPQVGN